MNRLKSLFKNPNEKLVLIIVLVGIILLPGTLYLSVTYCLNNVRGAMERNINDIKKQCSYYIDFLAADEAKSLIHMTEYADSIGSITTYIPENERNSALGKYSGTQRVDCILMLDENLTPDKAYSQIGMSYEKWVNEIKTPAITSVLENPKMIYSARVKHNGKIFDIVATARRDKKGVVFCAKMQESDKLKFHYSSVRNLLARNETSLKGSLYIAEGNTIIASNKDDNIQNKIRIPELAEIDSLKNGTLLTPFLYKNRLYYGGKAMYKEYDIYAFYPAKNVFAFCLFSILFSLCIYFAFSGILIYLHMRQKNKHSKEIEKQYEIIKSISHIYNLVVFVDLKKEKFTVLKKTGHDEKSPDIGDIDTDARQMFSGRVGEDYRKGFREFLNPLTFKQRLKSADCVEYDYKDISNEWINDKIIPQSYDEDGLVATFIYARRNISSQKREELEYQQKLENAVKNEQAANKSKTEFLRSISHDVRTPINVILGMLEIADRNSGNDEVLAECRRKMRAAAEYLLDLVNDILMLNKVGDTGVDTHSVFDLEDEVENLYLIVSERAKTRGISFDKPKITVSGRALVGNPLYLRQIMMNIITNAIKYNKENGEVLVSVSEKSISDNTAEIIFVCKDNGIGMSEEFQKKMFEPFAQENDFVVSKKSGVGLGLPIVKKLVEKLGGTINVKSEKNRGTIFEITVPYEYSGACAEKNNPAPEKASVEGLNIILAEDNEINMEIAEYLLTDAGAKVSKAYNGKEVLGMFKYSKPGDFDAIVTDVSMPVMDGLEEARCIRDLDRPDAKTIPIIAMTANLFDDDKKACIDAGMSGYVGKPIDINQLISMISQQVRKNNQE